MVELRNPALAFKKNSYHILHINSETQHTMEESFQKQISGFSCKFLLNKETLQIACLSPDRTYQLAGSFSTDNIPENIRNFVGQSSQDIYGFTKDSNSIQIEEGQLIVGYQIGKKIKFFELPLVRKALDERDMMIAELKKENKLKQVTL